MQEIDWDPETRDAVLQLYFISFACKESGKIQLITLNMETKLMQCDLIEQIRFLAINHAEYRNQLIMAGFLYVICQL
jgi:hypothetical protein